MWEVSSDAKVTETGAHAAAVDAGEPSAPDVLEDEALLVHNAALLVDDGRDGTASRNGTQHG